MKKSLLQVFNRYLIAGGEEKSVDRIYEHLSSRHAMSRCFFESSEWRGEGAPSAAGQASRLFYNPTSRARFEAAVNASGADVALFHNVYPVGSPSLYHAALRRGVPVVQYLHNFRPFSVGGTLYVNGRVCPDSLHGDYGTEVRAGAWQNSVVKSALFALMLKMLHRSGWLESVKAWVAISEFVRDRIVESGLVPPERIHALRHAWDPMSRAPRTEDSGRYLFLGRLVPEKGVTVLLDAWDALRAQLGDSTPTLQFAGEGPQEPLVQERARGNRFVEFLGRIGGDTKSESLRRCRALIVPSTWWEPLGLVVYEAYDHAKPVLAARSGGLVEVVQPGITGLLHAPGDVDGLVRDVLTMEGLPHSVRIEWGAAGRAWLLRETDKTRWLDRLDEIFATL
jgi:glycosyltransferase involved in cell wall biosynthesis